MRKHYPKRDTWYEVVNGKTIVYTLEGKSDNPEEDILGVHGTKESDPHAPRNKLMAVDVAWSMRVRFFCPMNP